MPTGRCFPLSPTPNSVAMTRGSASASATRRPPRPHPTPSGKSAPGNRAVPPPQAPTGHDRQVEDPGIVFELRGLTFGSALNSVPPNAWLPFAFRPLCGEAGAGRVKHELVLNNEEGLRTGGQKAGQLSVTAVWPASVTVMAPPQAQLHWESLSRAAVAPTVTWAEPGVQSPTRTGWQGWGVRAPTASLTACTCGLFGDSQRPKGCTFAVLVSVTTPAGAPAETLAAVAVNVAETVPNEHFRVAPVHTRSGMAVPPVTVGLPWLWPSRDSRAVYDRAGTRYRRLLTRARGAGEHQHHGPGRGCGRARARRAGAPGSDDLVAARRQRGRHLRGAAT